VPISFETDRFLVKTVENATELTRVQKLRHDVFYSEIIIRKKLLGLDKDKYDHMADHLVVLERATGNPVATYRMICSTYSKHFYSESEFNVDNILALPGDKLELGRACVRKDYRKGIMIVLLWRALSLYLKATGAHYMFGCSSVQTLSVPEIAKVHAILSRSHLAPEAVRTWPRPKHTIKNFADYVRAWDKVELVDPKAAIAGMIPPLLQLYLDVGSVICGEPAIDRSFKCADFLTLLDIESVPPGIRKKYNV
jgi:putative hemolysin